MLETIVQHEYFRAQMSFGPTSGGYTVGVRDHCGGPYQISRKQKSFIARLSFTCQYINTVGNHHLST
jgi:hypothetical protein